MGLCFENFLAMLRYIIPRIQLAELPPMFGSALLGGLAAGLYGVLHDQVTYTISPEYFTKLKFEQFAYADFAIVDEWAFVRVAYIHNASYLGGLLGLLVALVTIRRHA